MEGLELLKVSIVIGVIKKIMGKSITGRQRYWQRSIGFTKQCWQQGGTVGSKATRQLSIGLAFDW